MRLALLTALVLAPFVAAASTGVVELEPAKTLSATCATNGAGSSVTVTTVGRTEYELVASEDLVMCEAATCASGGADRPKGNHGVIYVPGGRVYSCRSTTGTAKLSFVPVVVRR